MCNTYVILACVCACARARACDLCSCAFLRYAQRRESLMAVWDALDHALLALNDTLRVMHFF